MLFDSINYLSGADHNILIAFSTLSTPTDGALLGRYSVNQPFTIPAGMTGSNAESETAPTAAAAYSVKKNGVSVGTINFALGANDATFTMATDTDFVLDDILTLEAPATADVTHDLIAFTIKTVAT